MARQLRSASFSLRSCCIFRRTRKPIVASVSIIAAVREAHAYRKADKELIKQYRFMRRIFGNVRTALDRAKSPANSARSCVGSARRWPSPSTRSETLMHRERPFEHARI
jgi:hypothetical protein